MVKKKEWIGYEKSLEMLGNRNVRNQDWEDVFWDLTTHASEYIHELMADFQEEKNREMRITLLELIHYARSPEAFHLLVEQLHADNAELRFWAIRGLQDLDTKEARRFLWDYFQLLKVRLYNENDVSLRIRAIEGLAQLGTKEARWVLRNAKELSLETKEETAKFQKALSRRVDSSGS